MVAQVKPPIKMSRESYSREGSVREEVDFSQPLSICSQKRVFPAHQAPGERLWSDVYQIVFPLKRACLGVKAIKGSDRIQRSDVDLHDIAPERLPSNQDEQGMEGFFTVVTYPSETQRDRLPSLQKMGIASILLNAILFIALLSTGDVMRNATRHSDLQPGWGAGLSLLHVFTYALMLFGIQRMHPFALHYARIALFWILVLHTMRIISLIGVLHVLTVLPLFFIVRETKSILEPYWYSPSFQ